MTEMNPCAVHVEREFDLEDYRSDLERRVQTLNSMETKYHKIWLADNTDVYAFTSAERMRSKARGIEIALSLLPPKETPRD